jgi:glycosyltransferase involved in cell wall biosynthesis
VKTGSPLKLAVLCTHPIQYYAPVFRELAARSEIELKVFYGWDGPGKSIDPGFGVAVKWDIPLLDGYKHEFVPNISESPGSHHFYGIDLPTLNSRIEDWNADALLVYGWSYKAHLAAIRHFVGKLLLLFRGDSNLLDESWGFRRFVRRWYLRSIYKHVDVALAVGTNNRVYYEALGLSSDRIVFAPHAVDNARFDSNAGDKEVKASEYRDGLGIKADQAVVLFVGKLEAKKAPELLLTAFEGLPADSKVHLVFVGTGELESQLKLTKNPNVHFLGFQNQTDMEVIYRVADLVALPSRGPGETWGLALNEAMACGRAVLATNRVGAACDLIMPGRNGWIVQANDLDDLTRALREAVVLGRPVLHQMGTESQKIISNWSIPIQVDAIVKAACHAACKT